MTQKRRKPEGYDDMTHDELLAEIDRRIGHINKTFYIPNTGALEIRDLLISNLLALRAVVELHKPRSGTIDWCEWCQYPSPCQTIQAIMKELK